jgi:DNA-binding response OmpR family regulator
MRVFFNILHVEDDDTSARVTANVLRHFDSSWRCESVGNLETAIDLLKANRKKFGVILLDLRLPGIAGLEGLKRIVEVEPNAPVVIYTATVDTDLEDRAFELGAQSYIYKPCDNDELYRRIKRAAVRFYGTCDRIKIPAPPKQKTLKDIILDNKAKAAILTGAILALISGAIAAVNEWLKTRWK